MHCCTPRCSIITVVIGSILCIGSGLLLFFTPNLITSTITKETELSTGSFAYDMWRHIPVNIYRKFYAFNYINCEAFVNGSETVPIVEQLGPYVYKETRYKIFIDWDSGGEFVRYRETHRFDFVPALSEGTEDDYICTPNVPLLGILATINSYKNNDLYRENLAELALTLDKQTAFVNQTVGTILFYGYKDDLLEAAQKLIGETLPGSMYAMFYGKNETDDGHYEIHRGMNNISEIYKVHKWNDSDSINLWPAGEKSGCNMFNGTDGSFYWPGIKRNDRVNIFISDVCRNIFVEYVGDMDMYGISGYKYASNVNLFADPNMNSDNYCYCNPSFKDCLAPGITNLGPCKFDAPIYLSHPHFKFTDIAILNAIEGLDPNNPEEEYRTVVNIEPYSGNLIAINVRFQISVLMNRTDSVLDLQNVPESTLLPLIWVDENSTLDSARVDLLNKSLFLPMNAVYGISYALISLTGFIICLGVSCSYNLMFRFRKYAAQESLRPTVDYFPPQSSIPRPKSTSGHSTKTYDSY